MLTGADRVIVVMSGDFVQRGAPAVIPKHLRAESALLSGASLIIELPVCFATGSAEYFAQGSISLLNQLGCIDSICFGSECGDLHLLKEIAQILADEPIEYQTALKQALKEGASFPAARQEALNIYSDKYSEILASPNNILGIEYLKALAKIHSKMEPFTIKRIGAGYHDMDIDGQFSSATAIRSDIYQLADVNSSSESLPLTHIQTQVPSSCHELMKKNYQTRYPVKADDFSLLFKGKTIIRNGGQSQSLSGHESGTCQPYPAAP